MVVTRANPTAKLWLLLTAVTLLASFCCIYFSPAFHLETLQLGVAVDLLVVAPLFFWFFLKSSGNKYILVAPFTLVMVAVTRLAFPEDAQYWPQTIAGYLVPAVELVVFGTVILNLRKLLWHYRQASGPDFGRKVSQAATAVFGQTPVSNLLTAEINIFYYLFSPRKPYRQEFTYHKRSGIVGVLITVAIVAVLEAGIVHLVLYKNYPVFAWVLLGLSLYSVVQIISLTRALVTRRIFIKDQILFLHYGWLNSAEIKLENLAYAEVAKWTETMETENTVHFGLLKGMEDTGLLLETHTPITVTGFYGKQTYANRIFLPADQSRDLCEALMHKEQRGYQTQ